MPYYGHLRQRPYIDQMHESKDWFEDDETETLRRPMTDALRKLLERVLRRGPGRSNDGATVSADAQARQLSQWFLPSQPADQLRADTRSCGASSAIRRTGYPRLPTPPAVLAGGRAVHPGLFHRRHEYPGTGVIVERLPGKEVSASTVSELAALVDDELRRFHRQPLDDKWRWLGLDGVWLKVGGYRATCRAMLVVCGVRPDGRREVIAFRQARIESRDEWGAFLWSLYRRRLRGEQLQLVSVDGGKGLWAAVGEVYPHAPRQRCWARRLRNVSDKVSAHHRELCMAGARSICLAASYWQAASRARRLAQRRGESEPDAVRCLETDIEDLLVHMQVLKYERRLWVKVRTMNVIEWMFRELRKRTRPMGCFANPASCDRIVYMSFKKLDRRWQNPPLWTARESTQRD